MNLPLKSLHAFWFCILIPYHSYALDSDTIFKAPSEVTPPLYNHGYALFNVVVGGVAPSFEFIKLHTKQRLYLESGEAVRTRGIKTSVDLKGIINGYYLMNLPEGLYQITSIRAPFYNLPFRLDTDYSRKWRFKVEKGKTSYVGKLSIAHERKTDYVEVHLVNRIATDELEIERHIPGILTNYPLSSGTGVRDDFWKILKGGDSIVP